MTSNMPNETCDYGDLKVTLTSDLQWMWNEKDTGGDLYGEFYHAMNQGDMRPLGGFSQSK
ncbi:hypothetical protein GGP41_001907 [Bipolaris sorokiniana]|uniref:Uncharacterized protein n=1 Tax=Cochliobolus sativus TaxID=45130 RepID=A0A8H5ZQK5_COCSA|nr:hypothetical protein GGP41_001907 [Bipolaris sorokiniana]